MVVVEDLRKMGSEFGKERHGTEVNGQQYWDKLWPCMGCDVNNDDAFAFCCIQNNIVTTLPFVQFPCVYFL